MTPRHALRPGLKATFAAMQRLAFNGPTCEQSYERIAAVAGLGVRQTKTNVAQLRDLGYVDWTHARRPGCRWHHNVYTLCEWNPVDRRKALKELARVKRAKARRDARNRRLHAEGKATPSRAPTPPVNSILGSAVIESPLLAHQKIESSNARTGSLNMTDDYFLSAGSHRSANEGRCAMEWVAYIAGEPHTDHPVCISPVLRDFATALNDNLSDEPRQKMRPYLARCIGTRDDGRDQERRWLAIDWAIRVFTPRFLDLIPDLAGHAAKLRALSPVLAAASLCDAMVGMAAAETAVLAVQGAAATSDVATLAVRDAGWAAAWCVSVRAGAANAVEVIALAAASAAVEDALKLAVEDLQASVLDLFDRMLPKERLTAVLEAEWRAVCAL